MPPKKKVKEHEANQQVPLVPQQNLFKIPKKPFYRSVQLDSDKRAKLIQIKLWKINSLKAQLWDTKGDLSELLANQDKLSRVIAHFSKKQRVFKNLKRFDSDAYMLQDSLILRSWRLEKLSLDCVHLNLSMKKFITKLLNPHLKDFFIKEGLSQKIIEKPIHMWEPLVNCNLWFHNSHNFNTKDLRSFKGSKVIKNIEGIFQDVPFKKGIFDLSSNDASHLPNLKTLRVDYSVSDYMPQPHPNLDFIKNYPQLTTLVISTSGKDVPSFEFLSSLPNLTRFTLNSCKYQTPKIPRTLPTINSLEKLKISCYCGEFPPHNIQEFLLNNKDLKHLEVQFSLKDYHIIFDDNLILPIQALKLTANEKFHEYDMTTATKKLASFLSKQKHLQTLHINLGPNISLHIYENLLKGLTSMTCLENLTWSCEVPNELQENKLKNLKKTLIQCPGIQKLELNFGQGILTSKDFSNVLDGLLSLEKLKYLFLKGNFIKITPATINKFTRFLNSLILENAATVKVYLPGMPLEITQEIDRVIAQKSNLW